MRILWHVAAVAALFVFWMYPVVDTNRASSFRYTAFCSYVEEIEPVPSSCFADDAKLNQDVFVKEYLPKKMDELYDQLKFRPTLVREYCYFSELRQIVISPSGSPCLRIFSRGINEKCSSCEKPFCKGDFHMLVEAREVEAAKVGLCHYGAAFAITEALLGRHWQEVASTDGKLESADAFTDIFSSDIVLSNIGACVIHKFKISFQ